MVRDHLRFCYCSPSVEFPRSVLGKGLSRGMSRGDGREGGVEPASWVWNLRWEVPVPRREMGVVLPWI